MQFFQKLRWKKAYIESKKEKYVIAKFVLIHFNSTNNGLRIKSTHRKNDLITTQEYKLPRVSGIMVYPNWGIHIAILLRGLNRQVEASRIIVAKVWNKAFNVMDPHS